MALQKDIELDNGVVLSYHRISSINKVTNVNNIIEVNSYINEKQREKEKEYYMLGKKIFGADSYTTEESDIYQKGINVFVQADIVSTDYNPDMTIEDAYEYLKTTDKYKGAKDC